MGKFEERGLDAKEIEFRRTAQLVFQHLKPSHRRLTYAMVLDVMRKARKKTWSQEEMEINLKKMISMRKKRLQRRLKESALNASKIPQSAS